MKSCKAKTQNIITGKHLQNQLQLSDILSCLFHHRCSSAKHSPYQNQTSIERLKHYLETTSRQKSPRISAPKLKRKSLKKTQKPDRQKKSSLTNRTNKVKYLVELNTTNNIEYAPTLYPNQLFRDAYDSQGNHDRLLITPHSSFSHKDDESFLAPATLIVPENQSLSQTSDTNLKQPNNSNISEAGFPEDFNALLFEKLSKLQSK